MVMAGTAYGVVDSIVLPILCSHSLRLLTCKISRVYILQQEDSWTFLPMKWHSTKLKLDSIFLIRLLKAFCALFSPKAHQLAIFSHPLSYIVHHRFGHAFVLELGVDTTTSTTDTASW